jgi:L-amino acid N-acyltransferase YncA
MLVRFASVRDAEALAAIYAPIVETTAISFETFAPDAAEMRSRIGRHPADKPWIVAETDDAVVGYAYAGGFRGRAAYRFSAEVTVYVAERARRRGVGRTLYRALARLLASQGYRRAFAAVTLPNGGSVALHDAAGFTAAGVAHAAGFKFGCWHDVGFFECALAPLDAPLRDPLDVAELDAAHVAAAFERSIPR